MRTRAWWKLTIVVSLAIVPPLRADVEGALIVLEAPPGTPGSEAQGAPPRFALLEDGQVFVGGSAGLETTRLEKGDLAALRKRIDAARKVAERLGRPAAESPSPSRVRVRFQTGKPAEATIDPTAGAPTLQPLTALVNELLRYDPPGLVRYAPASFALSAQQRSLAGGCRAWSFRFPIADALAAPVAVAAADAVGWPTGAWPASVCVGDKRFVVTLRPLLPGERP